MYSGGIAASIIISLITYGIENHTVDLVDPVPRIARQIVKVEGTASTVDAVQGAGAS